MKWFIDIKTLEELRKEYKKLVVKYHPDNGGSDETLKLINVEYEQIFERLKYSYEHSESYKNSNDRQKQTYEWKKDIQIRDIILKVSRFDNINIEICGVWIWLSGETKQYKNELKELGFHWAKNKERWYIHFDDYHKFSKKATSMDYIRMKYGSVVVQTEQEKKSMIKG